MTLQIERMNGMAAMAPKARPPGSPVGDRIKDDL